MKQWALKYAKMGFSVIPISPKTKVPLIKFADKPALTELEIIKLWDEYPSANIALRTDKFFVIDVDVHGVNGFESLTAWKHKDLLTPTLVAKTASGGRHYFYFKREDSSLNQQIGFLDGVDIKAHVNNYVLVAPSATSAGVYEWDIEQSAEGGTMTTASRELVNAINSERKSSQGLRQMLWNTYHNQGEKTKTAERFETILRGFGGQGGRNANLTSFTAYLLRVGLEPEDVLALAEIANSNSAEPLPNGELRTTVLSMIKKHARG